MSPLLLLYISVGNSNSFNLSRYGIFLKPGNILVARFCTFQVFQCHIVSHTSCSERKESTRCIYPGIRRAHRTWNSVLCCLIQRAMRKLCKTPQDAIRRMMHLLIYSCIPKPTASVFLVMIFILTPPKPLVCSRAPLDGQWSPPRSYRPRPFIPTYNDPRP